MWCLVNIYFTVARFSDMMLIDTVLGHICIDASSIVGLAKLSATVHDQYAQHVFGVKTPNVYMISHQSEEVPIGSLVCPVPLMAFDTDN